MIWAALAVYYILGVIVIHKASPKVDGDLNELFLYQIVLAYLMALQLWIIPFILGILVRGYTTIRKGK